MSSDICCFQPGAVAAFDFGIGKVQTWKRLDVGSHNDDYSNDIIARAQWLITHHSWTFGTTAAGM